MIGHYLEEEFYHLIQTDKEMIKWLESGSLDGIWYWDLDQPENEWMSSNFWATLGHDPATKQHLAAEWQDMIFEEDLQQALQNFKKHLDNPDHPYDQVVRYRHKAGSIVTVRCRGIAIRDKQGRAYRMLGAHTDITHLIDLESENSLLASYNEQLKSLNSKLERAVEEKNQAIKALHEKNEELDQYAYTISHDLREPLRTISTFVSYLMEDIEVGDQQKVQQDVEFINNAVKRSNALIQSLFDLSQAATHELINAPLSLDTVLTDTLHALTDKIKESHAKIEWRQGLPKVKADKGKINSVFQNLITNAIKFHKENDFPTISIKAEEVEGGRVLVKVSDQGIGVQKELINQMFMPFKQCHQEQQKKGLGIGLTLVKKILERYQSKITVESTVGAGTTISFDLPGV